VALSLNRAEGNRLIRARLAEQARRMERAEARLVRDARSVLEQLRRDLAAEAAKSELDMGGTAWQQARLRALLEAAERRIAEAYGEISNGMSSALKGMVNVTADGVVLAINEAAGRDFIPPLGWTDATLARIADGTLINGAISSEWWDRQRVGVTRAFADQMRMGMMKGETIAQLRDRVLAKVDLRKEPDYTQRDIIRCARRDAEALVRTSALTVCRQAHLDVYEANADVIAAVEWLSTLDDRTTPLCRALDGLEWTIPGYAPKGHDKPFPGPCPHWNCRSIAVPVTKTWEELAREDGGDVEAAKRLDGGWPNSQRASADGPVEGGTTYGNWAAGRLGPPEPPQLPPLLPTLPPGEPEPPIVPEILRGDLPEPTKQEEPEPEELPFLSTDAETIKSYIVEVVAPVLDLVKEGECNAPILLGDIDKMRQFYVDNIVKAHGEEARAMALKATKEWTTKGLRGICFAEPDYGIPRCIIVNEEWVKMLLAIDAAGGKVVYDDNYGVYYDPATKDMVEMSPILRAQANLFHEITHFETSGHGKKFDRLNLEKFARICPDSNGWARLLHIQPMKGYRPWDGRGNQAYSDISLMSILKKLSQGTM
jgi:hypothetical protein